jgi:hypothetical protein
MSPIRRQQGFRTVAAVRAHMGAQRLTEAEAISAGVTQAIGIGHRHVH